MTRSEWESLCDGCGRCCLKKLEDEVTREVAYTDVACRLLDRDRCRCTRYTERLKLVPDCIKLDASSLKEVDWLPSTCAYRRIEEGKPLEWWHPLVSGNPNSVHEAGISIRGRALSEEDVEGEEIQARVINWVKTTRARDR